MSRFIDQVSEIVDREKEKAMPPFCIKHNMNLEIAGIRKQWACQKCVEESEPERDYLAEARSILAGKSMMVAEKRHLEALDALNKDLLGACKSARVALLLEIKRDNVIESLDKIISKSGGFSC